MTLLKQNSSGFALLEVLVGSTLFAILISAAWFIAFHTAKTLHHNRRSHQEDLSLSPLRIDDCRVAGGGISFCARGEQEFVIAGEGT